MAPQKTGIDANRVKGPRKVAPSDKGPYIKYRQGALIGKEIMQTSGSYIQKKYRHCIIPTDKGPLQTIWGPYKQLRAPTDN